MSNSITVSTGSDKMKSKDFITIGIFTVLFFVITMICIFASAATVVTFIFGPSIAAVFSGIIYMLMRIKVPKKGSIFLSGAVIGIVEFLIGAGWPVAVSFIIGALLAELISASGNYRSFTKNAIGYAVYMTCFAIGTFLPMVLIPSYTDSMSNSNGVDAAYIENLHKLLNGPMVLVIAVVAFVAGMIGAFIAKALLNKHFKKAGIV